MDENGQTLGPEQGSQPNTQAGSQPGQQSAPPQWSPDGRAWWDGTQWIPRHVLEAQHGARWAQQTGLGHVPPQGPVQPAGYGQVPPQGPAAGYGSPLPGYGFAPAAPAPKKGGLSPWVIAVIAVVGVIAVFGLVGAVIGGSSPADDGPEAEQEFVKIVQEGQDKAEDGNEVTVVAARKQRADDICQLLPESLKITDWIGEVADVETTLGGDSGILDIEIANDINVTTWNNGFSDAGDGTLIDPDSDVYAALGDLEEGDEVTFSGAFVDAGDDCISEQSVFDTNGMKTPAFVFKFSEVSKN